MHRANQQLTQAPGNTFARRKPRRPSILALSASLVLSACGGGDSGNSGRGSQGGSSSLGDIGSSEKVEFDSDTLVDAADQAAALSEEDLNAALAAADLDNQMALAQKSGLDTELGNEMVARALWASVGLQMKAEADAGTFGTQTQSASTVTWPGVRLQAAGGGGVSEAFGAGWLGGSLFNAVFVENAINDYSSGKSGPITGSSPTGNVTATGGLSDTSMNLDATAKFSLPPLSATIETKSKIVCPDATGLMVINSSLKVTGEAGDAYQRAQFTFELIVEVDDDAKLTGRNQLKSSTKTHTTDAAKGYGVTDGSVDVSITEFADGHFGDGEGSYEGMTNDEAKGWLHMGLMSGMLYRNQLLPNLQKMLDAGRCVDITVEASAGPMNLDPLSNVDLLTKPRAKISNTGVTTGGTVKATFKKSAGGAIVEGSDKVPADATFHYIAPLAYDQKETVTFEARSKRGTGKLDYALTTSPHAD